MQVAGVLKGVAAQTSSRCPTPVDDQTEWISCNREGEGGTIAGRREDCRFGEGRRFWFAKSVCKKHKVACETRNCEEKKKVLFKEIDYSREWRVQSRRVRFVQ